jgi:Spy/CpxP family protein refolding chaperone
MAPHHDAMKSLFEKKKAAMDKLRGQIEAKASDSDVQATLDSIKGIRSEMKAEQEKFQSAMAGILSPTQQAKMILAMDQKMRGWMGHGKKYEAGKSGAMRREMPPKRDDSSEVEDDD